MTEDHSIWLVEIYDRHTDEFIAEFEASGIDRTEVCRVWGLDEYVPNPLLIAEEQLSYVNRHINVPLVLVEGREAFLQERAAK